MKAGNLSLLFIFSFLFSAAQQHRGETRKGNSEQMNIGHFYGKVIDSISGKPAEFVSVQLWGNKWDTVTKKMKQTVIAGMLTAANGEFSLEKLPVSEEFTLKISSLGFKDFEKKISFGIKMNDGMKAENSKEGNQNGSAMLNIADKDLGNIKLKPSVTELKGVEIIGEIPAFEMKLDKKVFSVDKNLTSAGGTAEDVLKNVPSVNVDMDGNVTLRNAAPQIFVDGKSTTLSIDQIPADAIESIELITNPSAKYDASGGGGGILNIVLKKNRRMGYNGNLRAGVDRRGKLNGGADINARENKINIFLSTNMNQRYSQTLGKTERYNLIGSPKTNSFQQSVSIMDGFFGFLRGGMDWFVNNRNTFTLAANITRGNFKPGDVLNVTTDTLLNFGLISPSAYKRNSNTRRQFINVAPSLQYKHLFPKEGQELTADLNYNKSSFENSGDYTTYYYDVSEHFNGTNGTYNGISFFQKMKGKGYTEMFTSQMDYVHPFSDKTKIETGVKGSYKNFLSKTDNFLKSDSTGEFELVKNQSANYKFNDQIYAAYATFSKQLNKFSFQAGLRGESSFYIGELLDSNKTFKNYFPVSLFPSAASTYDINGKDNFQLSYSRKINRPTFFQLIPFTDYSDSLNLKRGNAGLKPEFTSNVEFSYLKTYLQRNNILISVYFKNTLSNITSYVLTEFDTVLNRLAVISTYQNANSSYTYGGEFTLKQSVKKWLDITLNLNAYNSVINAKNIQVNLSNEQFSYFAKLNSTFKLPENFTVQFSSNYFSRTTVPSGRGENRMGGGGSGWMAGPTSTVQGYVKPKFEVELSVKYEFLKDKKASLSVSWNDILKTKKDETVTESDFFTQTSSRQRDPQFLKLNFSYRFGKFDASILKRKNTKVNTDGMEMGM